MGLGVVSPTCHRGTLSESGPLSMDEKEDDSCRNPVGSGGPAACLALPHKVDWLGPEEGLSAECVKAKVRL